MIKCNSFCSPSSSSPVSLDCHEIRHFEKTLWNGNQFQRKGGWNNLLGRNLFGGEVFVMGIWQRWTMKWRRRGMRGRITQSSVDGGGVLIKKLHHPQAESIIRRGRGSSSNLLLLSGWTACEWLGSGGGFVGGESEEEGEEEEVEIDGSLTLWGVL